MPRKLLPALPVTNNRLVAVRARGAVSCANEQDAAVKTKTVKHSDVRIARFIGPLILGQCCRLINMVPPVPEIRKTGPPPLTGPSATTCPPSTRTDIPGKSDTILRILPANSFCARIVTPKLDGMITVMSPPPVERKESDMGLPANRLAMMLPMAVETRTLPEMLSRFTPPPAFSQRTPSAEPTFTGPPEF